MNIIHESIFDQTAFILLHPKKAASVLGVTLAEVKRLMEGGFCVEVGGDSYFVMASGDLRGFLDERMGKRGAA